MEQEEEASNMEDDGERGRISKHDEGTFCGDMLGVPPAILICSLVCPSVPLSIFSLLLARSLKAGVGTGRA